MKKLHVLSILVIVLGLCGIVLLIRPSSEPTPTSAEPRSSKVAVQIGYSRLRISLPIFVAMEKRLFEKYGLEVSLVPYDTAQPMTQALAEGKIHAAGYTALPITYNAMHRSAKPLYYATLMLEDQQHRISYLLRAKTPPGETPKIQSVADLAGKRVGVLPTVAYQRWLVAILKANQVDPASVTIQDIDPTVQGQTLKSGGVDALFTGDPVATAVVIAGAGELLNNQVELPSIFGDPFAFGSFNFSKQWADENQRTAEKVVLALDEAIDFINANPAEANLMMKSYLQPMFQPHVDKYPPARYQRSTEPIDQALADAARQYLDAGIIPAKVDVSGLGFPKKQP